MPHSSTTSLCPCASGAKDRRPAIAAGFRAQLWACVGDIARNREVRALAARAASPIPRTVHCSPPPAMTIAGNADTNRRFDRGITHAP